MANSTSARSPKHVSTFFLSKKKKKKLQYPEIVSWKTDFNPWLNYFQKTKNFPMLLIHY